MPYQLSPGEMPKAVADTLAEMCRRIQEIEVKRVLRDLPRNNLPIFLENPPYPPLEKGGIEGIPWF
jgi:hypothetical protein